MPHKFFFFFLGGGVIQSVLIYVACFQGVLDLLEGYGRALSEGEVKPVWKNLVALDTTLTTFAEAATVAWT